MYTVPVTIKVYIKAKDHRVLLFSFKLLSFNLIYFDRIFIFFYRLLLIKESYTYILNIYSTNQKD